MKIYFYFLIRIIIVFLVTNNLLCEDGILDPSFGTGGKVTTNFTGTSTDQANGLLLQPDGKIVAAGVSGGNYAVARYLTNGTLDSTFGTGGTVTTVVGTTTSVAYKPVIQSDGKIVVFGIASDGGGNDFSVVRYNTNGTLDTSFGTGGIVRTNVGATDVAYSGAIQPDNKILAIGISGVTATGYKFAIVRYNPNGTLDTSFGTAGIALAGLGGTSISQAYSGLLQPDGKILAAGHTNVSGNEDFCIMRFTTNGTLDTTFGTNGIVTTNFSGTSNDIAEGVALQSNGKIVVVGSSTATVSTNTGFAVAQYNTNGSIDTTFGTNGKVVTSFSGTSTDAACAVAIQPNGRIVAVGLTTVAGNTDFGLARYNTNGTLDTSFGPNGTGLVTTSFGGTDDESHAVILQPDGKIVAGGWTNVSGNFDFALARYFDCPGVLQVGSDTVVTLFTTQQFVAPTGRIAQLALLNGGFGLCGNATFDSSFPVSGPICLECYALSLKLDLIMNNQASFGSLGNISGNGHVLNLASGMTQIAPTICAASTIGPNPACTSIEWGNLTLALNNDVLLQDVLITFTGNSVINGQGNALTLDSNSSIIIDKEANLLLKNLVIYGVQGNNIRCVDTLSTVSLANVAWVLDSNYSFTIGSLDVLEEFSISGPSNSFNYQSDQASTIWAEGVMKIEYGVTFNYSPSTASKNLLSLSASTSELELNGATLTASAVGMNLLKGLLTIKGASTLKSLGANQSQGISLGDGLSSSNNLTVHITPAAQLVIQGPVVSNDA